MNLHQWDVVRVRLNPKDRDLHPAVVISCEEDCSDTRLLRINVLYGSKLPPGDSAEEWQVRLNGADGLEFPTVVDCGLIYMVDKALCAEVIGRVTPERRRQIGRKIIEVLRLLR